ncbi:MAG: ROK family protein, partial [Christensenellaceae bacterium]|nr:ROK family protein [Christensenellaceae bacterium]
MNDKSYLPMKDFVSSYNDLCTDISVRNLSIALKNDKGNVVVKHITVSDKRADFSTTLRFVERFVKTMLWAYGGYEFIFCGQFAAEIAEELSLIYSPNGARKFDYDFFKKVYSLPLFFHESNSDNFPKEKITPVFPNLEGSGNRIGFDAGGSDRKVTAVKDGKVVFENETVWLPKINSDINYHIDGVADSVKFALDALDGKCDKIGVSTAGIVVGNEIRVASLFVAVDDKVFAEKGTKIYADLERKFNAPVSVINDGDAAALAGSMQIKKGCVLGIAMGTSLACGYIGSQNEITGYLNELAFIPVDANENGFADPWSGDSGVGAAYLSQDGIINLFREEGGVLNPDNTPAEKLKEVQALCNKGDKIAEEVFTRAGEIFGDFILYLTEFYDIKFVNAMGRVVSGKGGDILIDKAD